MNAKSLLLALTCTLGVPATTPAAPPATGRLQVTFTERSPHSAPDVVPRRLDWAELPAGDLADLDYDLGRESFDIVVPTTYKPNVPHGLLVWMGVTEFSPEWFGVLARHKLIYVSANNTKDRLAMCALPLDAVHNLKKTHNIDESRVYVCGFSAGGALATRMLRGFPDVFRGGLFLLGGYFYYSHQLDGGRREPTVLPQESPTWKGAMDSIKADARIVLVKGQNDTQWTPQEGRCDHDALLLDGFTRASYLEVPGLGHNHPNAAWFEKGVAALEAKPRAPPTTRPTTQPRPLPGQVAQAQRVLATALFQLDERNWKSKWVTEHPALAEQIGASRREQARKYLHQVLDEFPTTPAAAKARQLLPQLGSPTTSPATATKPSAPLPGRS
jgi:predicted esterase